MRKYKKKSKNHKIDQMKHYKKWNLHSKQLMMSKSRQDQLLIILTTFKKLLALQWINYLKT